MFFGEFNSQGIEIVPKVDNLAVGSYGWQLDRIASDFYPEDLPEDWQLDYYCNFSNLVVVPQSIWSSQWAAGEKNADCEDESAQQAREEMLEEFQEALTEESYVYLVLEQLTQLSVVVAQLESLSMKLPLSGIIFKLDSDFSEAEFKQFLACFSDVRNHDFGSKSIAVSMVWPQANQESQVVASQLKEELSIEQHELMFEFAGWVCIGCPVLWLDSLPQNGKQQSQILQEFMSRLPAGLSAYQESLGVPVIVAGCEGQEHIQMNWVQNLKTVSELLGY